MLMDLSKDIMMDLGITVIGDIIAILRHAKQVYRQVRSLTRTRLYVHVFVSSADWLILWLWVSVGHVQDGNRSHHLRTDQRQSRAQKNCQHSWVFTLPPFCWRKSLVRKALVFKDLACCSVATHRLFKMSAHLFGLREADFSLILWSVLSAATRMIANALSHDSPPSTPARRPDNRLSITVSNTQGKTSGKTGKRIGNFHFTPHRPRFPFPL